MFRCASKSVQDGGREHRDRFRAPTAKVITRRELIWTPARPSRQVNGRAEEKHQETDQHLAAAFRVAVLPQLLPSLFLVRNKI